MTESTLSRRDFMAAGAALGALPVVGQDDAGLVVHEWGVVTVPYGSGLGFARSEGARFEQGKEIAEELPPFVVTYPKAFAGTVEAWQNMPVRKPIVYFHAKRRTAVSVRVSMPQGRPHAWWPVARDYGPKPALPGRGISRLGAVEPKIPTPEEMKPEKGMLFWPDLVVDPDEKQAPERTGGWWATARETAAAPVRAAGAVDKFLFYDALLRFDPGLQLSWLEAGRLSVQASSDLPHVFAVRVKNGRCTWAGSAPLRKGDRAELALREGVPDLHAALVAAGLYKDEAAGLVKIWDEEFFRADGARLLVVLPRELYDRILPVEISPVPRELQRVLVAHVECLDPDQRPAVAAAIDALSSDAPAERSEAVRKLRAFGPLASPMMREAADRTADAEVRSRLLDLLGR